MSSNPPAGGRFPTLLVTDPSGGQSRAVLTRLPFGIGRQSGNQLVLRDSRISRSHARIVHDEGSYWIEDLRSRHGVWVNNRKAEPRLPLQHGDQVHFGFGDGYHLTFSLEERDLTRLADHVSQPGLQGGLAKLRAVVEVARALHSSLSMMEVLESVVDAALAVTGATRGFFLVRRSGQLEVQVARHRSGIPLSADDPELAAMLEGALAATRNVLAAPVQTAAGAALCVPVVRIRTGTSGETILSSTADTIGLIYLDSPEGGADLAAGNRELLQTLALEASTVIENARLLEQEQAKRRMEDELRIAREIQQNLLPDRLPDDGWFRVAASTLPSQQVGGDYYDVARLSPSCWFLVVADVSGKGVSSALLASLLQGAFLTGASAGEGIRDLLSRINAYLFERAQGEKYATVFCAAVHREGLMHWCNAGHCPPLLVGAGGSLQPLKPTSMPLGMFDTAEYMVVSTRLAPGDRLVIYSDGLSDAQNPAGQYFEVRRIRELLAGLTAGAAATHAAIIEAVKGFTEAAPQRDDLTLVVAEYF